METHQLMGLTLVPVSLLGIICNWSVVFAVCKCNTLSHSFSLLTANQAVFNGIQCNLYFLYVAPMIILSVDINSLKQYSHVCGLILVICYDVSIQADFLITINRFLAVFLPVQYTTMFSKKRTKHMIAVSFFLSLFIVIVFFHAQHCHLHYDNKLWRFIFSESSVCLTYSYLGDFGKFILLCTLNGLLDTVTIWKVRSIRSQAKSQNLQRHLALEKKEMGFLKQTCGQAACGFIGMLIYQFGPIFTDNNVMGFLFQTFLWCLLHACEGSGEEKNGKIYILGFSDCSRWSSILKLDRHY
ncbi:CRE-SRX-36 protein [Caenorhabditis remanei]|uniref:CRE-SRX-36 protein n=1 Tax=Caenorhabditis remanei TaxID=31234 RepID=E3LPI5_CAERE|nr:CRE-SRX-36 protein [Caenorhabditis remanei]